MDFLFQGCAAIGGTVIALQFLLSIFGMGGEHGDADHAGGFDGAHDGAHDGSHDGAGDHAATWIFGIISLRTVSAGLAFFGLTGMAARKADVHPVGVVLMATAAGMAAYYAVGWIMRLARSLNVDGTVNIHQAFDCDGKVYVAIPGGRQGAGKVLVDVAGRTLEYQAKTPGAALATGTPVRVVDILAPNTVEVVAIVDAPPRDPLKQQPGESPPTSGDAIKRLKPQE